ncbi:MAG: hypothetical protein MR266_05175 [Erysipelotrichaceae bacterium]|nr:hypothetical protein [Erysipelotrichaceae bacterium]
MFKKRNHGMFCYCNVCRSRRKTSFFYNILTSIILIICLYQLFIILLAFTRINCFILFIEVLFLTFLISRSLF